MSISEVNNAASGIRMRVTLFLKVCLAIVVTLLLLEGTIRVYHSINPLYFLPVKDAEADLANRFRGKPFANVYGYRLNSKGFKDIEYPLEKPENTLRVVGIGDSFVYGVVPYPENFLTVLENRLKRASDNIEVINMGISGSDPAGYLWLLQNEALDYEPDVVMVFFYVGNDFFMVGPDNVFDTGRKKQAKSSWHKRLAQKLRVSYLFRAGEFAYAIYKNFNASDVLSKQYDDKGSTMDSEYYYLTLSSNADKYKVYKDGGLEMLRSNLWQREFLIAIQDIIKMKEICDSSGAEFHLVLIPEEMQVDPKYQSIVSQYHRFPSDYGFDYDIPNNLLKSQFRASEISHFDMLGGFREDLKARGKRLFRANDGHWNIEGNRVAADIYPP